MKKFIFIIFLFVFFFFTALHGVKAIENPLNSPNNKFGIHILFPEEIKDAAKLVNSTGGDWGYVLIPIQSGDKNIDKWQKFMDDAKTLHLIPIIRLATEGDYFNTKVWRKPTFADILDFANFLDSLSWPVKNRYIVVYNEPNRGDEWEGAPNPFEYANILNYAVQAFKTTNQDFFIISAGLDNAAPNIYGKYYNEYDFMREMSSGVNGIFSQIDGLGSHSYPNPGFSQPPTNKNPQTASSFNYEKNLAIKLGAKNDIAVFITETGWSKKAVAEDTISSYYKYAFENIWNQDSVIAVTPFLLKAGTDPFNSFSFLNPDGSKSLLYKTIESLQKNKGLPVLTKAPIAGNSAILGEQTNRLDQKNFSENKQQEAELFSISPNIKKFFKWLLKF